MTSPAVVALRCVIGKDIENDRIDRGEILYAQYSGTDLPELTRKGGSGTAIVTAEAVTLYKSQKGLPVSVPIVVLGKTEVILNGRHQKLKFESGGNGMPGTHLYYEYDAADGGYTKITDKKGSENFLGTVVHQAATNTYSVDLIVNFAK